MTNKYETLTYYKEDDTNNVNTDKVKTKRTRRGIGVKGFRKRQQETSIKMFSTNAAGACNKLMSLKAQVKHTNANVITLHTSTKCPLGQKIHLLRHLST